MLLRDLRRSRVFRMRCLIKKIRKALPFTRAVEMMTKLSTRCATMTGAMFPLVIITSTNKAGCASNTFAIGNREMSSPSRAALRMISISGTVQADATALMIGAMVSMAMAVASAS